MDSYVCNHKYTHVVKCYITSFPEVNVIGIHIKKDWFLLGPACLTFLNSSKRKWFIPLQTQNKIQSP